MHNVAGDNFKYKNLSYQYITQQESPPAWTQEAYRPLRSKYSFCCPTWGGGGTQSDDRGVPHPRKGGTPHPDLAGGIFPFSVGNAGGNVTNENPNVVNSKREIFIMRESAHMNLNYQPYTSSKVFLLNYNV